MENDTVYIIGAGASKEANLPTGYELKGIIANLLNIQFDWREQKNGDYLIVNALREHVKELDGRSGDINPYIKEAWHIRDALPQAISIDNFIDSQKGNNALALCGKLSIVRSILISEKSSLLHFKNERADSTIKFTDIENTWYIPFFQIITENCSVSELEERLKKITLIIFNYDRCVEHFLFHAFRNYYRVSEQEAAELVKNISIYHPYGKVGHLEWQDKNMATEFGADINTEKLLYLADKIKTFTEGTDPDSSDIVEIRRRVGNAQRIVFMGFAFHKLNMGLLKANKIDRNDFADFKCFATTLGISNSDKEVIALQISELYETTLYPNMANVTCHDLFTEYWRSLSF